MHKFQAIDRNLRCNEHFWDNNWRTKFQNDRVRIVYQLLLVYCRFITLACHVRLTCITAHSRKHGPEKQNALANPITYQTVRTTWCAASSRLLSRSLRCTLGPPSVTPKHRLNKSDWQKDAVMPHLKPQKEAQCPLQLKSSSLTVSSPVYWPLLYETLSTQLFNSVNEFNLSLRAQSRVGSKSVYSIWILYEYSEA